MKKTHIRNLALLLILAAVIIHCGDPKTPYVNESTPDSSDDPPLESLTPSKSGQIDFSFDVTHDGLQGTVSYIELLTDGKFLAGGINSPNFNTAAPCGIMRFNSDGTVDTSFNPGGSGVDTGNFVKVVKVLPNGQILAAGSIGLYNNTDVPNHIIRLNNDGTLDQGFNQGGSGVDYFDEYIKCMTIQPDGGNGDFKILIGGRITSYNGTVANGGLVRLHDDGTLDESFNSGGTGFSIERRPIWTDITVIKIQDDGKILIGGRFTTYDGIDVPNGIVRLNADGTYDADFNSGGTGFDSHQSASIYHISIDAEGKILVGGRFVTYNGQNIPNGIIRLNADGTLNSGVASISEKNYVLKLSSLNDGSILACGEFTRFNGYNVPNGIIRLNSDWTVDSTFNVNGEGADSAVNSFIVQPENDSILIGGSFSTYNETSVPFSLLRLNP